MTADEILLAINPPPDTSTFDDVVYLANNDNYTLCLFSTFGFVKDVLQQIIRDNISGNILLAGVWRGGLAAYIQACLVDFGVTNRLLYLADTFNGFVNITDEHPKDKKMLEYFNTLKVPSGSSAQVKQMFSHFGLPLENVVFLEGDIKQTTSHFTGEISLLMIDMDFYRPTRDCLDNVYKNVANFGFVYIDDYQLAEFECKDAVNSFIKENGLHANLTIVNKAAVYWIKNNNVA